MSPTPTWEIREGHVLDLLRAMPAESVHCCVTSPPYWGLRDYGLPPSTWGDGWVGQLGLEPTPEQYVTHLVEVFEGVRRVLRDDGTLWLNLGDSYAAGGPAGGAGKQHTNQGSVDVPIRKTPSGLKPKDLVGIPWRVALALQAAGWYLRSDIIWCLSGGTKVYARTQKGEMPTTIKDLVRLDPSTVQLWNGERWTQVLGWNRSERGEPLEIELRSGERIGCTPGHVWPTQRGDVRADELESGDVIQTTRLPEGCYSPAFIGRRVAWFLGLYLAEGSRDGNGRLQISGHTNQTEDRVAAIRPIAEALGGTVRSHVDGNSATVIADCPALGAIVGQYIHGKTAKTKGVKVRAWRHNDEWLAALVHGYLEGDGHCDTKNQRWRLGFTRNARLAADLRTLAARLGATLTLKPATGTGFGKTWPIYRGEWRWSTSGHYNERPRSEVVSVGKSRARKFWDIGVADAPHLFALASGVLTHNSKPNPMPESVTDRPTKSHEYMFLLSKSPRYFFDADAVREGDAGLPSGNGFDGRQGSARDTAQTGGAGSPDRFRPGAGRNIRTVWTIATQAFPGAHFAVFPTKLVEPCIKAGTSAKGCCPECGAPWERVVEDTGVPETGGKGSTFHKGKTGARDGGDRTSTDVRTRKATTGWRPTCDHGAEPVPCTVLETFSGAGTTVMQAVRLGRSGIGIELSPDYAEMSRRRVMGSAKTLPVEDWEPTHDDLPLFEDAEHVDTVPSPTPTTGPTP